MLGNCAIKLINYIYSQFNVEQRQVINLLKNLLNKLSLIIGPLGIGKIYIITCILIMFMLSNPIISI